MSLKFRFFPRRALFLMVAVSVILSCTSSSDLAYFEGEIVYEIEFVAHDENFTSEELLASKGSKMVLTFIEGKYKTVYYSPDGKVVSRRYFNPADKKAYIATPHTDTIYWIDITKNTSTVSFKRIKDGSVLDEPTIRVKIEYLSSPQNDPNTVFRTTACIQFAKNLKVNPRWYADYKDGRYNEIMQIGRGAQLQYTIDNGLWEQRVTAVEIRPGKVNEKELKFKAPANAVLLEL